MALTGDIYRWIYSRLFHKPPNFSWVIPDHLAGSGLIRTHDQFEWLLKHGIRSIVTVREIPLPKRYFENTKAEKSDNKNVVIDYLHIKVNDGDAPDLDVLIKTIDYMDNHIEHHKPCLSIVMGAMDVQEL